MTDIGNAEVEMAILRTKRGITTHHCHPDGQAERWKSTSRRRRTRQFYFEHDYYYTLVFISETGKRYTFATGDIELIDDGRGEDYECCEDQIKWHCQYRGGNSVLVITAIGWRFPTAPRRRRM